MARPTSSSRAIASPRSGPPARRACRCAPTVNRAAPPAKSMPPACMSCPDSSTCTAIMVTPKRPMTQAMPIACGWRMASPRCAACRSSAAMPPMRSTTSAAARPARSARRASMSIRPSAPVGRAAAYKPLKRRANGCAGRRKPASTASNSSIAAMKPPKSTAPLSTRPKSSGSAPSRICHSPMSPNSTPAMPPPPGLAPSRISMAISKRCSRTAAPRTRRPIIISTTNRCALAASPTSGTRSMNPAARNGSTISRRKRPAASPSTRPSTSTAPAAT